MDLPETLHDFLLVFLGSGIILGSLGVVLLTNPIFSAFSLGLVLVCISLLYILSNFHFVAASQLLIYVGAINILILFTVMFMNSSEYYQDFNLWTVGDEITLIVCTSIFVSLITIIPDTSWYEIIWTTRPNQIIEQDLISTSQQIGIHLSTDFFLPFELISIIILVALIGATKFIELVGNLYRISNINQDFILFFFQFYVMYKLFFFIADIFFCSRLGIFFSQLNLLNCCSY